MIYTQTINRFYSIKWGTDKIAVASDYWWNTRNTKSYIFNPSDTSQKPDIIQDRNYQDRYSDPGSFIMERNEMGSMVLTILNNQVFSIGDGFTKQGQFPFIDQVNLMTKKNKRIYQSAYTDKVEDIRNYDPKKKKLLVRIEFNL